MGYSQHLQPTLSSEASRGPGLPYLTCPGGSSRLPSCTPCARPVEGEGWGESRATLPELPQCHGVPSLTGGVQGPSSGNPHCR